MKHKTEEEYVEAKRQEAIILANEIINRRVTVIEGTRRMLELLSTLSIDAMQKDFRIFVAVDSDTDHLPIGELRKECSLDWLEKCDQEIAIVEATNYEPVAPACRQLIMRLSGA
jgi:hypothetical protein